MTDGARSLDLPVRRQRSLFDACIPAIPYAAAAAFLGREKLKLTRSTATGRGSRWSPTALGGMHGVTHTIQQIRDRGVPGFEVEVIGTDADVDRRLSAVAEIDIPFYRGLKIGVPTLPAIVEALAEGRYDLVHLVSPGPCGIGAWLLARVLELPVVGSYHTELAAYAGLRSGDARLEALMAGCALCEVLRRLRRGPVARARRPTSGSSSSASRAGGSAAGIAASTSSRFDPALRDAGTAPARSTSSTPAG